MARLEAVLIAAVEPLHLRKICQFASLADATEARTLVRQLNKFYDEAGTAFRVEEIAGGHRLMTRRKYASWLRRLRQGAAGLRLSAPALETLAVIAYRQPASRGQIEAIRGVQCGEMLRQLIERDLVKIAGRSEELGRPFLYGTTRRFLQSFGLRDLTELPALADVMGVGVAVEASAATADAANQTTNVSPETTRDHQTNQSHEFNEESPVRVALAAEHEVPEDAEEKLRLRPDYAMVAEDDDGEDESSGDDDEDDDEEWDDDEEEDEDEDDEDVDDDFDDEDWEEVDEDDEEWDEEEDDEDEEDDEEDWDDDDDEEDDDWEEDEDKGENEKE
ncbi:MAG: SMC-Scp complex subunit ScpB [Planctomycetes bacterium]|nr:SMC-Scp complex subunit ScpB [Planctomycetota bacterium]